MDDLILKLDNEKNEKEDLSPKIFDDVDIIVDPELEDESTIDLAEYFNKFILQCRICGNMFPSDEILTDDDECPICGETSSDGYIYKGKLGKELDDENKDTEIDIKQDDDIKEIKIDNIPEDEDEISFNVEDEEPQITIEN